MPSRALKPCTYPGCDQLVKSGRCDKHVNTTNDTMAKRKFNHDPDRQKLYDRKWRKRRAAHLAKQPWCMDCINIGVYTPATDVHHIIRHEGDPEIFKTSPLLSLCKDCHHRRTLGEIRGTREDYYPNILGEIKAKIIMVCGAPGSGKSTFVNVNKCEDDIVVDLDQIISSISNQPIYTPHRYEIVQEGIRARNKFLERLQYSEYENKVVWFIVSAPDPRDRYNWKNILKPIRTFIILPSMEVCIDRIEKDNRRVYSAERQIKVVKTWFEKYSTLPTDTEIDDSTTKIKEVGGGKKVFEVERTARVPHPREKNSQCGESC